MNDSTIWHLEKLQAGDDKRAVKSIVKFIDADNSVINALEAKVAELEAKLQAKRSALAYSRAYAFARA